MKKILIGVFSLIFLSACSGKVQTNPIPDPKKYSFPKQSIDYKPTTDVPQKYIVDYDDYVKKFFKSDAKNAIKSIWSIGLERGHYE
ncbi:hypothetical protein [Campylobacter sp. US33a]|uniref:hypothetical protein n=1 Tax=Campylobacter sp. US33a TaxID=2498120 RepID=UPI0010688520|nr:hypothetical protein [Campylobacter sp. US33a]TEY00715.1 hypothetical protein ELQ16_08760 [Campylobacter sp. US33a]